MINTRTTYHRPPFTERRKEVFFGLVELPRDHSIPFKSTLDRVSGRGEVINLFHLIDRTFTDTNRVNLSDLNLLLSNGFASQFHKKGVPKLTLLFHLNDIDIDIVWILWIQFVLRGFIRVNKGHPKTKSGNSNPSSKFRNVTDTWDVNDAMVIRSHLLCDSRMITGIPKKKCETRRITTWNLCDIHRESSFHNLANSIQISVFLRINPRITKYTV